MIEIFLSASIPLPRRDSRYYASADIINIREAVKSLVDVVLPVGHITFGGHPAITPLLALSVKSAGFDRERFTLFQSEFFDGQFPEENSEFVDVRKVRRSDDRESSLKLMRQEMIQSRPFFAGVFIGGMEGVEIEANLFREVCPQAKFLPVASTGAAASLVFREGVYHRDLMDELTYHTLFRRQLIDVS